MQMEAHVTGEESDLMHARAVSCVTLTAPERHTGPRVAKTHTERDLALFLGFQRSAAGSRHQAQVTQASKELAESVGGHTPYGNLRSTVFHRISRNLVANAGRWLLQHPLHGQRLQAAPGMPYFPCSEIVLSLLHEVVVAAVRPV